MTMLHENELINIEEDMIIQPGFMLRRFIIKNRINGLKVYIVSTGATVRNIQLGEKDEIVRFFENSSVIIWNPHVLGLDSLMLSHGANSVTYQLTTDNELTVTGKFRAQQADIVTPFYFNLNPDSDCIDGHLLRIKAVSTKPESEDTPCLNPMTDQFIDLTGSEPKRLERCDDLESNNYDSIYKVEGDEFIGIIVTLSYGSKSVEVTLSKNSIIKDTRLYTLTEWPDSCCQVRLRFRKCGLSIMPFMMSSYRCAYKFNW